MANVSVRIAFLEIRIVQIPSTGTAETLSSICPCRMRGGECHPTPALRQRYEFLGDDGRNGGKNIFSHIYNILITNALQRISKGINFSVNRILKGEEGEWEKRKTNRI